MVDETKEGRVLSGRNAGRIISAMAALLETLEAAGLGLPGWTKQPSDNEEEKTHAPSDEDGRACDSQREAGPSDDDRSPTDTRSMLAQLDALSLELELLEVT